LVCGLYRIVGKLLSADLDAEGNLHIVLKGSSRIWVEASARYLRQLNGKILKFDVRRWNSGGNNKRGKQRKTLQSFRPTI